ncbi:ImmA/IrrE family metallo-endopeptidase [Rhizobium ruizarguesonis]|uniref:ImmA/IrrE family metallo-endopeptidase n=1 Tax=Rhizobium ruizarguesonis TaxID=2081791 RepID=A0AAE8Q3V6_9HYPH|nr:MULTISPECIES: ImmA/IrrE family metallo-endopeptidase [Rhizobium]NEH87391.1 ImmA/IrrE family metallo-endopeptidase [Rhizobium ruizarguesonis]NEI16369.1 ImmA/IrrE family metallo-endopeptidase [Rhizobium ruizarguesonis]NEJ08590.1 ImmA/IrrE family metallo-endopeptidase [Rhizobium ruizarguesonis]NEJ16998.1 ImmA/IrrE family metallo-endopeptidase [Rhizobium ruizarguesonis]NEJ59426.1 ImmA/IrrE family metallo-endopeptidase [Rhizobium ruizarguesonis]
MKPDDSSLSPSEYAAIHRAATDLLNKASAWDRLPTPVPDLLGAAKLRVAPMSAFDPRSLLRHALQFGERAASLVKSAIEKVRGIFDVHEDLIHIDTTVTESKQNFLKLREAGHKHIPHQSKLFRWIQDCDKSLSPDVSDQFEREANIFATVVLFQDSRFAQMAADSNFSIKVPLTLSKKFGASIYASLREYVRRNERACAVIVLNPAEVCPVLGMRSDLRRLELSPLFQKRFGKLQVPEHIDRMSPLAEFIPLGGRKMSRPGTLTLEDKNGDLVEFVAEGFATPYNSFILIHAVSDLRKSIVVPAGFLGGKMTSSKPIF